FGGGASAGANPFGGGGNPFGGGRRRRSPAPQKGEDVTATVSVPLATAVLGGTIPVTIRRERGGMVSVDAKIPVGIETGKKIRLRGMGEPGVGGGPNGDVILEVEVAPHPFYSRSGKDLTVKTPITLKEAAFGAKVDVPTPRGTVAVTIPPGASTGTRLRLKGLGVAPDGEKPGDLYVECAVALPKSWSKEDLELLQKLDSDVPNVREKLLF
ncbi:MAG: J domain-containing protein, partial [Thermoguttaceae bacterium]|nr:J domain-containing protein [Thermoguttaceae bacterium]